MEYLQNIGILIEKCLQVNEAHDSDVDSVAEEFGVKKSKPDSGVCSNIRVVVRVSQIIFFFWVVTRGVDVLFQL